MQPKLSLHVELNARRPYGAALLLWLAQCLAYSSVLLLQALFQDYAFLGSHEGHIALRDFIQESCFAAVIFPALIVWQPRIAVATCGLLAGLYIAMAGAALLIGQPGAQVFIYAGSAALSGIAARLALRSRREGSRAASGRS